MDSKQIVIIGGGAAGSAAAQVLHQSELNLEVVVVGAENRLPYNRTTVNKGLLSGAVSAEDIAMPGMDMPGVHWRIGRTAVRLDTADRSVQLDDGTSIAADAILLAPGATPRNLPGSIIGDASSNRVLSLRNLADTQRLRAMLEDTSRRVLIAGAGLIGTETAGILLAAGADVTLTDPSPLPMQNHLGQTVARWVAEAHAAAGADFRTRTAVSAVQTIGNNLQVTLDSGSQREVDLVLTAFGVTPATQWLADAGVRLQDGPRPGAIIVDGHHRVDGVPGVYAAGDAAAAPGPNGIPVRVEHWGAALSQGRTAATTILNDLGDRPSAPPPAESPSSYSTYVHGTKLTIVGTASGSTREQLVLGEVGAPRFAVSFFDAEDRITGAVGVGGARAVNRLRPFIASGATSSQIDAAGDTAMAGTAL
ncbi:NAD(P)/FAD-dependent oxidoreductase [Arthrobacter castelli]|uniref:NAD(P)/FAD-dependent oxidoreductase n=1 Tax=Arthrobacter castelli TaxID=271431 RepID=UPI000427BB45|nr:NAD(P)/FAD-dependent oxidoreductase [Arthrobacter castelli]